MAKLTRRDFLKYTGAAAALIGAYPVGRAIRLRSEHDKPIATFSKICTFGYVSAEMPGSCNLKVYLDGEDVSGQCNEANDREGWVNLLMVDKDGHAMAPLQFKRIYGHVVIKRAAE